MFVFIFFSGNVFYYNIKVYFIKIFEYFENLLCIVFEKNSVFLDFIIKVKIRKNNKIFVNVVFVYDIDFEDRIVVIFFV